MRRRASAGARSAPTLRVEQEEGGLAEVRGHRVPPFGKPIVEGTAHELCGSTGDRSTPHRGERTPERRQRARSAWAGFADWAIAA